MFTPFQKKRGWRGFWLLSSLLLLLVSSGTFADFGPGQRVSTGTNGQTVYYNGTVATATSAINTNGTQIGMGITAASTDHLAVQTTGNSENGVTIIVPSTITGYGLDLVTSGGTQLFNVGASGTVNMTAGTLNCSGVISTGGVGIQAAVFKEISITPSVNTTMNSGSGLALVATALTITLPNANTYNKTIYTVKDTSASNNVTVVPSTGLIDGASSLTLTPKQSRVMYSDGTNWQIIAGFG